MGTKAETLAYLSSNGFPTPNSYYFKVSDWKKNKKRVLDLIFKKFKNTESLAVRSSSFSEDLSSQSMAGAFQSYLNVNAIDKNAIVKSINGVIDSYDDNLNNQILIQNMIDNVNLSGVLMTKVLDDGSPYYVINFDDSSGKTDSITSGNSINKTVFIYNGFREEDFDNITLLKVLKLVKKIELKFLNTPLDIEFAVNKDGELFILQVRPITTTKKWKNKANDLVQERLPYLEKFVNELMKKRSDIYGDKTLLGIMPDWNPAEMIGLVPSPLAMSLYRNLITKDTWRIARELMGYQKMPELELMVSLFGRAYIDVRNSINSFLPKDLSPIISDKVVNAYIKKLDENPNLHDKIEFEVVFTSYEFDFEESFNKRYPGLLTESELTEYKNKLLIITKKAIENDETSSLNFSAKKIEYLKKMQGKNSEELNTPFAIADKINTLISECIEYGTIPFAIAARHGFIAESLLKSLIKSKSISLNRVNIFKKSIKTISTDLATDFFEVCNDKTKKSNFLIKYGHLRPNSYDILSPTYNNRLDLFSGNPRKPNDHDVFRLSKNEENSVNKLIVKEGFDKINANDLFIYMEKSIKAREYQKFIFTKHLSEIIELSASWGNILGFSRNQMSLLTIEDIKSVLYKPLTNNIKSFFKQKIEKSELNNSIANSIKLNYLIRSKRDIYIAPIQRSTANFIGSKRIEAAVVFLDSSAKKIPNIENKIICIEGADPGYDWIFSRKIAGLITKFGGVNSHMAIRCAEYDLPAAIGCGEQPFNKIIKSGNVLLNCKAKQLEPILI
tara:strand:+ start:3571 stop:5928 length:2358 start_codon:yes stop_codon:yes gene_type:complete